jgi:hypothetical protein
MRISMPTSFMKIEAGAERHPRKELDGRRRCTFLRDDGIESGSVSFIMDSCR